MEAGFDCKTTRDSLSGIVKFDSNADRMAWTAAAGMDAEAAENLC